MLKIELLVWLDIVGEVHWSTTFLSYLFILPISHWVDSQPLTFVLALDALPLHDSTDVRHPIIFWVVTPELIRNPRVCKIWRLKQKTPGHKWCQPQSRKKRRVDDFNQEMDLHTIKCTHKWKLPCLSEDRCNVYTHHVTEGPVVIITVPVRREDENTGGGNIRCFC